MKNLLLVLLLFLSFMGCKNTPPKLEVKKQEQFKAVFTPESPIRLLIFTLNMEKDSGEITYYALTPRNRLTNTPPQTIVYDTTTFKIGGEPYWAFVKKIREFDYKKYEIGEQDTYGYDGINPSFYYVSTSNDSSSVNFESIKRRKPKVANELIDAFFAFTDSIFEGNKTRMDYLHQIKKDVVSPLSIGLN
jgi:hypothetical protein